MTGIANTDFLELNDQSVVTLSSGVATITHGYHLIAAESGTADDLDTLTLSVTGPLTYPFVLLQADTGDTITVKNGTGNINLNGGADFSLSGEKALLLFRDGTNWSDVGAGGGGGPLTTKGDVYTFDTADQRLAIGANDTLLTADSVQATGNKWAWGVLDEDDMASDSDTNLVTQQSIKKYVDDSAGGGGGEVVNRLDNNNFDAWDITTIDATTVPINSDDTEVIPAWRLLSDGNDIVDITQYTTSLPDTARYALQAEVETANKKFGFIQILQSRDSIPLAGETVSLSFAARTETGKVIENIRAAVLAWSGAEDSATTDVVSAWAIEGTNPTLVANWTYENTPANLNVGGTLDTWQIFSVENVAIDTASTTQIAVFVWVDDTDAAVGDVLQLGTFKLEIGAAATTFTPDRFNILGHGARVTNSIAQSIPNVVTTLITFDTEYYDTDSFHSTSVNPGRFTIPFDGKYIVGGHVQYAAAPVGYREILIKINGATFIAVYLPVATAGNIAIYASLVTLYEFSVGDYVELHANQNSGGALNINAANNFSPEFWIHYLGD
jgi:hypothetical protein